MIYADLQSALDARLETVVGLPTLQAENTLYNTKGKALTPYVRSTLLPSEAIPATLGSTGKNEYSGLYQIDLFYPLDGGKAAVNAIADLVVAAFARTSLSAGSKQVEVRAAWCEAGSADEQFYKVPVVARWRVQA